MTVLVYTGEPMATAASAVPGSSVDLALEGGTVTVTGAGSGIGATTARLLGAAGDVVDLPIHDRRIGIELADPRRIPKVVGVAGGKHKAEAILGALHGGFLDVLVTNELTAIRVLELR
jgi:DNA-binding transcriptional regulator LsrR (DeoR family)